MGPPDEDPPPKAACQTDVPQWDPPTKTGRQRPPATTCPRAGQLPTPAGTAARRQRQRYTDREQATLSRQQRIRATFAPDARQRITELYNGTFADAIAETLQNARRAGADTVLIDARIDGAAPDEDRVSVIRIRDNGGGIASPEILLTYGDSDWPDPAVAHEAPAGMGLASLGAWPVTIATERPSPDGEPERWQVRLERDAFTGGTDVPVEPWAGDGAGAGTSITFRPATPVNATEVRRQVEHSGRHAPLTVFWLERPATDAAGDDSGNDTALDGFWDWTATWASARVWPEQHSYAPDDRTAPTARRPGAEYISRAFGERKPDPVEREPPPPPLAPEAWPSYGPEADEPYLDAPDGAEPGLDSPGELLESGPYWQAARPLEREDFLQGCVHIETDGGLRIGITRQKMPSYTNEDPPSVNFFGHTLRAELPDVVDRLGHRWTCRIDMLHADALRFVLPARKEIIHDARREAAMQACRRVLASAIRRISSHRGTLLCPADQRALAAAGETLPAPCPALPPLTVQLSPMEAYAYQEVRHKRYGTRHKRLEFNVRKAGLARVRPGDWVIERPPAPEGALLAATLATASLCPDSARPPWGKRIGLQINGTRLLARVPPVWFGDADLHGADWYDELPKITGVSIWVEPVPGRFHDGADPESIYALEWEPVHRLWAAEAAGLDLEVTTQTGDREPVRHRIRIAAAILPQPPTCEMGAFVVIDRERLQRAPAGLLTTLLLLGCDDADTLPRGTPWTPRDTSTFRDRAERLSAIIQRDHAGLTGDLADQAARHLSPFLPARSSLRLTLVRKHREASASVARAELDLQAGGTIVRRNRLSAHAQDIGRRILAAGQRALPQLRR